MEIDKSSRRRPGGMADVFLMAYPSVITMFTYSMMGVADTFMVGKLGTSAIAAVGLTSTIFITILSLFIEISDVVNTFSSQAYGSGNMEEASHRAWQGIYLALLCWPLLLLTILGFDGLLRILGPSPEVRALGYKYLSIRIIGSGLLMMVIALASFYRGVGMVKTPMIISVLANILNIGLGYTLIFGKLGFPALGVVGAAWAANVSLLFGALVTLCIFLSKRIDKKFKSRSTYRPEWGLMIRMLRIGVPSGVQFLVDVASFTVFMSFLGRLGDTALAASQIAVQITAISWNTCWGFSIGTTTLVGQYIGAGRTDLAERTAYSAGRIVLFYVLTLMAVVTIFPERLVGSFTRDDAVRNYGMVLLGFATLFMLFDGLGMIAVGALRGAGDTRWPMVVALIGSWGVFLPLAWFLGQVMHRGVIGAWSGWTVYIIGVALAYIIRFRGGKWKSMEL